MYALGGLGYPGLLERSYMTRIVLGTLLVTIGVMLILVLALEDPMHVAPVEHGRIEIRITVGPR